MSIPQMHVRTACRSTPAAVGNKNLDLHAAARARPRVPWVASITASAAAFFSQARL